MKPGHFQLTTLQSKRTRGLCNKDSYGNLKAPIEHSSTHHLPPTKNKKPWSNRVQEIRKVKNSFMKVELELNNVSKMQFWSSREDHLISAGFQLPVLLFDIGNVLITQASIPYTKPVNVSLIESGKPISIQTKYFEMKDKQPLKYFMYQESKICT